MLTQPFHSILGVFLLTIFIGSFFPKEPPTRTFILLLTGGLLHLLLDMMMWPWGAAYPLLFPLTGVKYVYNFGLLWPGDPPLSIFLGLPIAFLMIYDRLIEEKTITNNSN